MSAAPTTTATASTDPSKILNKPLPLSAAQEQQVRNTYYANVRSYCAKEIKEFADCARGKTLTSTFWCREQNNAMNRCMVSHATPEEFDKAREQWFQEQLAKRAEYEAQQKASKS
ncbi:hypothetical protein BJ508DRAFT_413370 [Ascobolus immersus RN42]|uniref:COX assembly mitochondrial protein n=1 Tax=Ascobolus immersus RN42 TaxID=1160509 RepID=A0A3N4IQ16_ASCIM|nr:hypothetical protein BJ508DRAFT_413370 [Ascobolus immersus RN42]